MKKETVGEHAIRHIIKLKKLLEEHPKGTPEYNPNWRKYLKSYEDSIKKHTCRECVKFTHIKRIPFCKKFFKRISPSKYACSKFK